MQLEERSEMAANAWRKATGWILLQWLKLHCFVVVVLIFVVIVLLNIVFEMCPQNRTLIELYLTAENWPNKIKTT